MIVKNIFENIPAVVTEEITDILVQKKDVRIERIISKGQSSPPGFWYDQDESEWIIIIKGSAKLKFENVPEDVEMKTGDYLNIPSHLKHRVEWTDPNEETIWLTAFYK